MNMHATHEKLLTILKAKRDQQMDLTRLAEQLRQDIADVAASGFEVPDLVRELLEEIVAACADTEIAADAIHSGIKRIAAMQPIRMSGAANLLGDE